jgi:hypothetical protein
LNRDTLDTVASVAEVILAAIAFIFALWSYWSSKRSNEAFARDQKDLQASALVADQADRKVSDFRMMLKHAGSQPLQVLSDLELEELGSDQSIRSALERIEKLCLVDPWEGKADAVEHVNLVRFFSHVRKHEIDLATADLPAVAQKVFQMGGERHRVEIYRRRSRRQLVLAASAAVALLILIGVRVAEYRTALSSQPEPPLPERPHGEQGSGRGFTRGGGADSLAADSGIASAFSSQSVDSGATRDPEGLRRWNAFVATQVADTRELTRAINDSITRGAYVYAVGQLREARSRMAELQSQSPEGGSHALQDMIRDLDLKIDSTANGCQEEAAIEVRRGGKVPVCP